VTTRSIKTSNSTVNRC